MNCKTIYKQADSRWGSKPYPTKASNLAACGCGCCSCTHIALEQTRYQKWTPETLRPWMVKQGFAVAGQGTTWDGITLTLKHIGHKKVFRMLSSDPMSKAWKELNKGNRIGILLFGKGYGGSKKVLWTTGGHYISFVDYKVKNGKHYFYCKDSGGRNHDGWYNYEEHMKGVLPQMWIVERLEEVEPTDKKEYTGKFPNPCIEHNVIEDAIAWGLNIASDNSYIYKTWNSKDKNTKVCSWCNSKLLNIPKYKGANCIGFVGSMFNHGAGAAVPCACNGLCAGNERYATQTLAKWQKRNGKNWKELKKPVRGCVIDCFDKDTGKYRHLALSLGDGYILDATSGSGIAKRKSSLSKYNKKYYMYTGKSTLPARTYLQYGDVCDDVKLWQDYLEWYSDGKFKNGTGTFGDNTLKWTKIFQTKEMSADTADGLVGAKTIAKAKTIKK